MTNERQQRPLHGTSRRSLRLGTRDPRDRREADSRATAQFVQQGDGLVLDSAGRIALDMERLRKALGVQR